MRWKRTIGKYNIAIAGVVLRLIVMMTIAKLLIILGWIMVLMSTVMVMWSV